MDPSVIAALVQAAASAVGTGVSGFSSKKNREFQAEQNELNRDYATQMTTAQWERDDTSLQRQVLDAQAAGLSPLAVTGAMNSSSPLNWVGQAPQMDLSNLIGMLSSSADSVANIFAQKGLSEENSKQKQLDRNYQLLIETQKLNAQIGQWNKDNELTESEQIDAMVRFNKTMQYQYDVLNSDNLKFTYDDNLKRLQNTSQNSITQYQELCKSLGVSPKTKEFTNYSEYLAELNSFWIQYGKLALGRGQSQTSDKTTLTSGENDSLGSTMAGIAGLNFSEGNTESASVDLTKSNSFDDLSKYLNTVYFPIFSLKDNDYKFSYKYDEAEHYSK